MTITTTAAATGPARPLFEPFRAFELDMLTLDQIQAHIGRYARIIDWLKGEAFAASDTERAEDIDEAANTLGLILFNLESWAAGLMPPAVQPARLAA